MKKSVICYIILTLIVIIHTVLYFMYEISLRGYWTDKVLIWSWLIATVAIIYVFFKKTTTKIYLGTLILLLALSIIPMGLPLMAFYGFVTAADRSFTYRLNPNIRIQEIWKSPMVGGSVELVKEIGLIEQVAAHLPFEYEVGEHYYVISEAQSVSVRHDKGDSLTLLLSFPKGKVIQQLEY